MTLGLIWLKNEASRSTGDFPGSRNLFAMHASRQQVTISAASRQLALADIRLRRASNFSASTRESATYGAS